jgi:hypothetical protein
MEKISDQLIGDKLGILVEPANTERASLLDAHRKLRHLRQRARMAIEDSFGDAVKPQNRVAYYRNIVDEIDERLAPWQRLFP